MTPGTDNGTERDAWLREALRHAPDAAVAAPPAVSDAILRQARSAATTSSKPLTAPPPLDGASAWRHLSALWSGLAQPAVASGFAGIMVATLVGMLWWNRPTDETMPRSPAIADAPASAAATVAALPAPSPTMPLPAADSKAAARAVPAGEPAERREQVASTKKAKATDSTATSDTAAAMRDATSEVPRAQPRQPGLPADQGRAMAGVELKATQPAAPRATEAQGPPRAPAPAPLSMSADRVAKAVANAAPATASRLREEATDGGSPLSALRSRLTASSPQWAWQRGAGPQQPMTPAVERWLARLDESTLARWRPAPQPQSREPAAAGAEAWPALRLLRGGQLQATLHIGADAVRIEANGESITGWQATLPTADADALARALDDATR